MTIDPWNFIRYKVIKCGNTEIDIRKYKHVSKEHIYFGDNNSPNHFIFGLIYDSWNNGYVIDTTIHNPLYSEIEVCGVDIECM